MIPHQDSRDALDITRQSRSSFAIAFRFMPREKALALSRLYAFFRIADDCVDLPLNPAEKVAALKFWREEMHRIYNGGATHPVMQQVGDIIKQYHIPQATLDGLMDGCALDITKFRYADFKELKKYCYHVAGLVGLCCMRIFEYSSPTADETAITLGYALQITNILRDVREDFANGRIYIPQEILKKHGCSEDVLKSGKEDPTFRAVMKEMSGFALEFFSSAHRELLADRSGKLRPAKMMYDAYHLLLVKIIQSDYSVLSRRIRLSFFDKVRIMLPYLGGWK